MLRMPLVVLPLVLIPISASALPNWATAPDSAAKAGHTFTCQGEGRSEEDALAAARAICEDKICKVCGVEVESVVTTRETLRGVDLQRRVVERCRRVRRGDDVPRLRAVECGPSGCAAVVQVFFSAEAEGRECPAYAREDFADPTACEGDVEGFRAVTGRSAKAMHERVALLDRAVADCEKIDVRPTPAITALEAKLVAGLDAFEFSPEEQEREVEKQEREVLEHRQFVADADRHWEQEHPPGPWDDLLRTKWDSTPEREARRRFEDHKPVWARYVPRSTATRQRLAETKLLIDRLRLARDLVAARALSADILEASHGKDLTTAEGVDRVVRALDAAPIGDRFGAPSPHREPLRHVGREMPEQWRGWESKKRKPRPGPAEARVLGAWFRGHLRPDELDEEEQSEVAFLIARGGRVGADDWAWALATLKADACLECVAQLLAASDHGGAGARAERLFEALATTNLDAKRWSVVRRFQLVAPVGDAGFVLEVVPRLEPGVRDALGWSFWQWVIGSPGLMQLAPEAREPVFVWARAALRAEDCTGLDASLTTFEKAGGDAAFANARTCDCLKGELASSPDWASSKKDLLARATARHLPCGAGR